MHLYPAERLIFVIIGILGFADVVLIWLKDIDFYFTGAEVMLLTAALFFGAAQAARRAGRYFRFANILIVLSMFFLFTYVGSNFNVLLLPRPGQPIDPTLVAMDAWFGYSWPDAVAWISNYPFASNFLRNVYLSTQNYLFLAFAVVGALMDVRQLHRLALACVLGGLITIFCWALMPSSGASAFWTLDPKLHDIVRPIVGSAYGAELNRLLVEGVTKIDQFNIKGLIGFPSFHAVMAFVIVPAFWPMKALRLPVAALAAAAVPGILIHGGHNLMDVFGGTAVLVTSWVLSGLVLAQMDRARQAATVSPEPATV